MLKGELKGEEALEGPKSARPAGRTIDVCRGLLAEIPVETEETEREHQSCLSCLRHDLGYWRRGRGEPLLPISS